jgi:hypothetical protein
LASKNARTALSSPPIQGHLENVGLIIERSMSWFF